MWAGSWPLTPSLFWLTHCRSPELKNLWWGPTVSPCGQIWVRRRSHPDIVTFTPVTLLNATQYQRGRKPCPLLEKLIWLIDVLVYDPWSVGFFFFSQTNKLENLCTASRFQFLSTTSSGCCLETLTLTRPGQLINHTRYLWGQDTQSGESLAKRLTHEPTTE